MRVRVGELDFDVVVDGPADGPPVLLLHGFPEGARCWQRVLPGLTAAGCRVAAPDQRGYSPGARPADVEAYGFDRLVGDAVGLMDALGWANAHVVGHDWGAVVSWLLASWQPERVRTLTAVSVPHPAAMAEALASDPEQQKRSAYIALFRSDRAEEVLLRDDAAAIRGMYAGSQMSTDEVAAYVAPLQEPGALSAALAWYRAYRPSALPPVGPVGTATTFVWGDGDVAVGRTAAEGCRRWVTGDFRFVELDGVSHWVPEQVPDELALAVLARVRG